MFFVQPYRLKTENMVNLLYKKRLIRLYLPEMELLGAVVWAPKDSWTRPFRVGQVFDLQSGQLYN